MIEGKKENYLKYKAIIFSFFIYEILRVALNKNLIFIRKLITIDRE
jgi:hypothetical protein